MPLGSSWRCLGHEVPPIRRKQIVEVSADSEVRPPSVQATKTDGAGFSPGSWDVANARASTASPEMPEKPAQMTRRPTTAASTARTARAGRTSRMTDAMASNGPSASPLDRSAPTSAIGERSREPDSAHGRNSVPREQTAPRAGHVRRTPLARPRPRWLLGPSALFMCSGYPSYIRETGSSPNFDGQMPHRPRRWPSRNASSALPEEPRHAGDT